MSTTKAYYERQAKKYYELWERATDAGNTAMADKYMIEYLNYKEMLVM